MKIWWLRVGIVIILGCVIFYTINLIIDSGWIIKNTNPYGGYNDRAGGWPNDIVTINNSNGISLCSSLVGDSTDYDVWSKWDCSVVGGKGEFVRVVD